MQRPLALIVDGERPIQELARAVLDRSGMEVEFAESAGEAVEILKARPVSVLVTDVRFAGMEPSDLLRTATRLQPTLVPIVLGVRAGEETAVEIVRAGAFDVLPRPPEESELALLAERALVQHRLLGELRHLRNEARARATPHVIVGESDSTVALRERLHRLAASEVDVLFVGEEGTGRRLAARTLHGLSSRRDVSLVSVDCASIQEPEPFAAEPAGPAGTGLEAKGPLGAAQGGVLFLERVSELPLGLQNELLETLRESRLRTARGTRRIPLDVRIFSSTTCELEDAVRDGRFSEGLCRRLCAAVVRLVPLRGRREDISLLAQQFIETICVMNSLPAIQLSAQARSLLEHYSWPGNITELRDALEHAITLAPSGTIEPSHLPDRIAQAANGTPAAATTGLLGFRETKQLMVKRFERSYLEDLLAFHHGNVTAAAMQAGMLRSALQRLLRKHDLRSADYRRDRRGSARRDHS